MNHKNILTRSARDTMTGMSLVEILVAMTIGLIGMTIILQVYAESEGRKRTITGTSDAQITGSIAMVTVERELRNSGYGILTSDNNMLGCNTVAYDNVRSAPDFNFTMAPVIINNGAGGASDQITIVYGDAAQNIDGADFANGATPDAIFPLSNAAGFRVGEIAVASDPGAGIDCAMIEITGFSPGAVNDVVHDSGVSYTYTNAQGLPVTYNETYNKPGGLSVGGNFTDSAQLFSLGRNPTVITYVVSNNRMESRTLVPFDPALDSDGDDLSEADIADGVFQLQAQYGKDTDADRVVDVWDEITPATVAGWLQVQAVRFALAVRSSQFERTPVTTVAPAWYGGAFVMTNVDGTPDSNPGDDNDWRHYRYRTYQTVVPLQNMIWGTEP